MPTVTMSWKKATIEPRLFAGAISDLDPRVSTAPHRYADCEPRSAQTIGQAVAQAKERRLKRIPTVKVSLSAQGKSQSD